MRTAIPKDWWRYTEAVSAAHKCMQNSTAVVVTSARHKKTGRLVAGAYSCFLLSHRGLGLLTTAGHVVRQLAELSESGDWELLETRLVDAPNQYQAPANGLVLPFEMLRLAAIESRHHADPRFDGVDIGFIELDRLTLTGLKANASVRFFAADPVNGWSLPKAEGMYLLGVPKPGVEQTVDSDGRGVTLSHTCLPVHRLKNPPDDLCRHAGSLYGTIRILRVNGEPLSTIKGMSGGPIVAVARTRSTAHFQLAGIQSSWKESSRHIRATSIEQLISLIDLALDDPDLFKRLEGDKGVRCSRCAFEE